MSKYNDFYSTILQTLITCSEVLLLGNVKSACRRFDGKMGHFTDEWPLDEYHSPFETVQDSYGNCILFSRDRTNAETIPRTAANRMKTHTWKKTAEQNKKE